jgi:hypothetical protein
LVKDERVDFLNAGSVAARDDDFMLTQAAGLAAIATG